MKQTKWVTAALIGSAVAFSGCAPGEFDEPLPMTSSAATVNPEPLDGTGDPAQERRLPIAAELLQFAG